MENVKENMHFCYTTVGRRGLILPLYNMTVSSTTGILMFCDSAILHN